jgi:hypothetical protein
VYAPLIRIRTASICSVTVTPGSRDTAAASFGDSEEGATISRLACTVRRSGATGGGRVVPSQAVGTAELDIGAPPAPRASPGLTGESPVDGRTLGRLNRERADP